MGGKDNTFGNYIRTRRIELGLTQNEVAKGLGVAQNFVTYLEKGQRKPTNETIKKLARILSLPTDRLYLTAHPDLSEILEYDREGKTIREKLSPALEALQGDRDLCTRHGITDEEISQLATMKLRGEVKRKEDYVFLLMSVRQVLKG